MTNYSDRFRTANIQQLQQVCALYAETIERLCQNVRELARQRRLIEVMQVIDAELRIAALDIKGARARLSEFFKGAACA